MSLRSLIFGGTLLSAPAIAGAQRTKVSVDVGTAHMRYADSVVATALSLSPSLALSANHVTLDAFGTLSRLSRAWSNSGTATATLVGHLSRNLSTELSGSAGGSLHSDGARTGQLLGAGRLRFDGVGKGFWLGGGLGRTWDGNWRPLSQGEVGGWAASRVGSAAFTVTPTVVSDTIKYADAEVTLLRASGRWEAGLSLGARAGDQLPSLPANRSTWGSVTATRWLTPKVGVVASAGTYPVDFTQGFPGGQFLSLSLRFTGIHDESERPPEVAESTASGVRVFRTVRLDNDNYRIRVLAPGARTLEIAGDFTQWEAASLQRLPDGWFQLTTAIPPGTHQVNIRINGGGWLVPPGLTPLKDEFGGSVGLLVVP